MVQLDARIREDTVLLLGEVRGSVLQGVAHFVALVTEGTMPYIILLGEVCCSKLQCATVCCSASCSLLRM